ncbi:hypothetical protein, partial [Klebsiella pneumoniae]|uniref:hypothetical protein n=1 Tax=Klebsiella pneumoniae TaxID=573 RepID=UPI001C3FF8B2
RGILALTYQGLFHFIVQQNGCSTRLIEKLLGAFCFYHSQTVLPLAGAKASSTSVIIPPCPDQPNTPPT